MVMNQRYFCSKLLKPKIALVNLVERRGGSGRYQYVATRVYNPATDVVTDEVLIPAGARTPSTDYELGYAVWSELPALDVNTKQLVGRNAEKYCTLIAIKMYRLETCDTCADGRINGLVRLLEGVDNGQSVYATYHVLGYTFMDVNGDMAFMTAKQLRESAILQHTHSVCCTPLEGGLYQRVGDTKGRKKKRLYMIPFLDIVDEDVVLEDEEVTEFAMYKALIGSWYTMSTTGDLLVDIKALNAARLESIEVPDGVCSLPSMTFSAVSYVKKIKLPESLYSIGTWAFGYMENLEEVNIPKRIKKLDGVFSGCKKLKLLDLSGIEQFIKVSDLNVAHLILPDVMKKISASTFNTAGILEFRDVLGAKLRVLKAKADGVCSWYVGKIVTNGPVVLGNYGVTVYCADTSILEPNVVGIALGCSFRRVDSVSDVQPWVFGSSVEFIYDAMGTQGYRFTEDAYATSRLRLAYVDETVKTVLPKCVSILQGKLSYIMCGHVYSSVVFATFALFSKIRQGDATVSKMPSLRWILPTDKIYTEVQIKRMENKLTPILSDVCAYTQEVMGVDLTQEENLIKLKDALLREALPSAAVCSVFEKYGMIYVGDYGAALRGEVRV